MNKVIVIGGGAAGMAAALAAAKEGAKTILLEKNEKLGKKLYITGKGRCNITNACDTEELFLNVPRNAKFLYSAFYTFDNFRVMRFFEEHGLKLKTERGNRVFPESDHSSDVIRTLQNALKQAGVVSYHYVDSVGYKELHNFHNTDNYLKNAEMQLEDDYGMIDGVINNAPKEPVKAPVPKKEETKSKKPSVLAKLRQYQAEDRQQTTQHRSAERDLI